MQQVILFDGELRDHLLPLCYLRPVAALRLGMSTIAEKWARAYACQPTFLTQDYLADLFPMKIGADNLLINGGYLPNLQLLTLLKELESGDALLRGNDLVAARLPAKRLEALVRDEDFGELNGFEIGEDTRLLRVGRPYDLFLLNDEVLRMDFAEVDLSTSTPLSGEGNQLFGPSDQLFIGEDTSIQGVSINTTTGPVYIGNGVEIMEGSSLRGPLAIGDHCTVKMGTRIYGASSFGPHCKMGGEINNVIFQGCSNKSHDGYLGNSVIGEWCNLGADTNCSNLKNNYGEVKLWDYKLQRRTSTGQKFCGLIMGDHSKTAINTMFNTGTVVGCCSNIFGAGFPPHFVPDFSWGGPTVMEEHDLEKAFATIELVMERRDRDFGIHDRLALLRVFEETRAFRSQELT